jgi:hypothetical protein
MSKAPLTVFASKSLAEHFVRGAIGAACLYVAIKLGAPEKSLLAFGGAIVFVLLSLWALRGCPVCWTIGLINTTSAHLRGKPATTDAKPEGVA